MTRQSPCDDELQNLYNEVWSIFLEDSPPVQNAYELPRTSNGKSANPITSTRGQAVSSVVTHNPVPRYSPKKSQEVSSVSPNRSGVVRPLPRTPVSPSSATSPSTVSTTPEPESRPPELDAIRATHYSGDSHSSSNGLLQRATSGRWKARVMPHASPSSEHTSFSIQSTFPQPPRVESFSSHDSHSSSSTSGNYTGPGSIQPLYRPSDTVPPFIPGNSSTENSLAQKSDNQSFDSGNWPCQHPPSEVHPNSGEIGVSGRLSIDASGEHVGEISNAPPFAAPSETNNTHAQPLQTASASSKFEQRPLPNNTSLNGVDADWTPLSSTEHDSYHHAYAQGGRELYANAGPSNITRSPSDMLHALTNYDPHSTVEMHNTIADDEYWEDEDDEDDSRFINFSLLSHMAVQLRDRVPRGTHVKGSIPYPRAFTGKDIVSTIQSQIQRELAINHGISTNDRRAALQIARSLQSQLFFYEVEWGSKILQDGVEDVYMFLDDQESGTSGLIEPEELPTGVVTMMTRCYSPSCADGGPCYAYICPRKGNSLIDSTTSPPEIPAENVTWSATVDQEVLQNLPESEINRQSIIYKVVIKEEQYIMDLDIVESDFIKPLRAADPPVIKSNVDDFIEDVFGNILDLRECNRRLLEVMYVRQREQGPIIQRIGDIFLEAATEFRLAYPIYIGHYPIAEKRLKDELDTNSEFRSFLEHCIQESFRQGESMRPDLKHYLGRPAKHLQKYPVLLEAIYRETADGNPDADFLLEAIDAIKNLQSVAQLRTFQSAMGKGTPGKWDWHDLVAPDVRQNLPKKEAKRQSIIFELIKGEMAYVKDLENINHMYIIPLRNSEPPIISQDRLEQFIEDVFHNYAELHDHHRKLCQKFQEIQREQHPTIQTVTAALFDAALNFREAYMKYIPNYPIAAYRIDDEMANNAAFKSFVEAAVRHPDAHRLDMKNFINRPIPRLLRYELLLKGILEETPQGHEDIFSIPEVIENIKSLGKESEPGVTSAKQKVELWRYNSNLVFKHGETIDMDLLDQNRCLIHSGKLLRQPESGLEWNGWSELFVLLFDNYMVMTKPKDKEGVVRYHVNRRPIPLDLLTPVNFTDSPTQRSAGLLRPFRTDRNVDGGSMSGPGASPEASNDSRSVYPLTLHHNGRAGGPIILYAESAQARVEWKQKIEEALGLRRVVQESNKIFEVESLSSDTFLVPSPMAGAPSPAWNQDNAFTGRVTCSVPFTTSNGRPLVAIGCAEGVWIGYRHDPKSMRRVLHLKMVTQCAMLEEFGIFLVLADKSLFAYHIEALVPSSPQTLHNGSVQVPQKLNGARDVQFFRVGSLHGRTLIIYMKRKGMDSVFRVLEPVDDKINEKVKAPVGFGSRLGFRSAKSEWFRAYRDFFLPSEAFDVIFLKARIVVLCAKGFELMDLHDFGSNTIPAIDDPRLPLNKRIESCRPMGMFRSKDDEFLLCYDEFGLYVDKHGNPSRSANTTEWEGTAERVAYHPPYILIFDSRFIEIRHVETGRLAQIIQGNDIRCIWDGRGAGSNIAHTRNQDLNTVQEAQVHAVMNVVETSSGGGTIAPRPPKVIAQNVVELIPTLPLSLPGSANPLPPDPVGYGQQSYFSPLTSMDTTRQSSYSWQ